MAQPSRIPPGGRALRPEEYEALLTDIEQVVARSALFRSLDEAGRADLLQSGYVAFFRRGETMMQEGESGSTMFLLLRGRVRVSTRGPQGQVQLAELGRGACVGEVSVLTGRPRTATVEALEDVDAVAFERHRIERLLQRYPKVRHLLLRLVEGRARDTIDKTVKKTAGRGS